MQPTEMVWTILVEYLQGIIPVKFGQNPMSGFRERSFLNKLLTDAHTDAPTRDNGPSQKLTLKTLCSGDLITTVNQYR